MEREWIKNLGREKIKTHELKGTPEFPIQSWTSGVSMDNLQGKVSQPETTHNTGIQELGLRPDVYGHGST